MTKATLAGLIAALLAVGTVAYFKFIREPDYRGAALRELDQTDPKTLEARIEQQKRELEASERLKAVISEYTRRHKQVPVHAAALVSEVDRLSVDLTKKAQSGQYDEKASATLMEKQNELVAILSSELVR